MKKLGKEIRLGEKVEHIGAYITTKCTVVMNGRKCNRTYYLNRNNGDNYKHDIRWLDK